MMRRLCRWLFGWGLVLVLVAPVFYTGWVSFSPDSFFTPPTHQWSLKWYRAFLEEERWSNAAVRSVQVALLSSILSVALATLAAYASHEWNRTTKRVLIASLMLPACLPPTALATGLLPVVYFTKLWGTVSSLVLVHAALGLPIAYLIVQSHLANHRELETVALGLGATRWQSAWRITLPLMRMPLTAAALSVFVLSLNETLISLFLATPTNETLPAVSWPQLRFAASPLVAVASCATAVIGTLGILAIVGLETGASIRDRSSRKRSNFPEQRGGMGTA